jgi:hypothetical protein
MLKDIEPGVVNKHEAIARKNRRKFYPPAEYDCTCSNCECKFERIARDFDWTKDNPRVECPGCGHALRMAGECEKKGGE